MRALGRAMVKGYGGCTVDSERRASGPRNRLLMTLSETADRLCISRDDAIRLVISGKLASVVIGGVRRVPSSSIHEYIDASFVEALRSA